MKPILMLLVGITCFFQLQAQQQETTVDLLQYGPSVAYLTTSYSTDQLDFNNHVKDYALTWITMASVVKGLKMMTHVARPDQSDFNSFPSGHAAVSFMGAELIRERYPHQKMLWITSYLVATTVSIQRVQQEHHRPLEVLSGALIGVASVHLTQLIQRKLVKRKSALKNF